MARRALTDTMIKSVKAPDQGQIALWDRDVPGLYLEVKPGPKKRFKVKVLRGHNRNRQRSLGKYPDMSLEDARRAASEFLAENDGLDDVRQAAQRARTVRQAVDEYLISEYQRHNIDVSDKPSKWKPQTVRQKRDQLAHVAKELGEHRPIASLNHYDFEQMQLDYASRNVLFNRRIAYFRTMISREIAHGHLDRDPSAAVHKFTEKRRDFSLEIHELRELFRVIDDLKRSNFMYEADGGRRPIRTPAAVLAIEVLARTGQRPDEIRTLRWSIFEKGNFVDMKNQELVFRDYKTAGKATTIEERIGYDIAVVEIFESLESHGSPYLFPSRHDPNEPISYTVLQKTFAILKDQMRNINDGRRKELTLYALRHTFATLAAMQGWTAPEIAKQLKHRNLQTPMKYISNVSDMRKNLAKKSGKLFEGF